MMKRLLLLIAVLAIGFYVVWPAWSGYQIKAALDGADADTLRGKIDFVSVRESLRPAAAHHAKAMMDDTLRQAGGPVSTILDDRTKAALLPKIVETSLNRLVTAENLIRIAQQGGTIKEAVSKIVKQQMQGSLGGLGGLSGLGDLGKVKIGGDDGGAGTELDIGGLVGGIVGAATGKKQSGLGDMFGGAKKPQAEPAPQPEPTVQPVTTGKARKFGFDNIKSFGFAGPLGLQVGVAQDPKAKQPDVTAEIGFRGLDWKLVALRPKF